MKEVKVTNLTEVKALCDEYGVENVELKWDYSDDGKIFECTCRIKESKPTFKDLCDVAYKAYHDGVIQYLKICKENDYRSVFFRKTGGRNTYKVPENLEVSEYLDYIDSYYSETFIIENEQDIKRIKEGAKVVLMNGSEFIGRTENSNDIYFENKDGFYNSYCLGVLRCATVTQSVK